MAEDIGPAARHGLAGRCPRCGRGRLFAGVIAFAPACTACRLDFAAYNVGDGAAAFLIFLVGAVVLGFAMWLELAVEPAWWVHVMIWLPLTLLLSLALMRLAKGILLAVEYAHGSRQDPS